MNYYEILECNPDASYEEIKRHYQKLAKQNHPDKIAGNSSSDSFIQIDEAWKTLRDEKLRKSYNATLFQNNLSEEVLVYAELFVEDLQFDCNKQSQHPCRCGNMFIVNKDDVTSEEETLIECTECSNFILIKNNCK